MNSTNGKKVLIVDDSSFLRKLMRYTLEKEGFEIAGEAGTGHEAVQKYRELNPPLVIMDVVLPRMDGFVALENIKKIDPDAKVIIMSSYSSKDKVMKALQLGAKKFLLKPFEPEQLVKATKDVLAGA